MAQQAHDLDIDNLLKHLMRAERTPQEEEWLRTQLRSKEMHHALWSLSHAVFPEQLCRVYVDELPHFAYLEVMGLDARAEYPGLKTHLALCSRCSDEYKELYQMISDAYGGEVSAAPSYPQFDLSFLHESRQSAVIDWSQLWEKVVSTGVSVHRLAEEVALSLSAPFERLATPLRPALVTLPVPAHRKRDADTEQVQIIQVLDLNYPLADLVIRIGRGPVVARRTTLVLDILQLETSEPIPAVQVTLRDENHNLLEQVATDLAGSVRFEDVEVGKYVVQVEHAEDIWEMPLTLVQ
jgi:hypothetical protein